MRTMRYPNAYDGIKKIYMAELLSLISAVLAAVGVLIMLAGLGTSSVNGGAAAGAGLAVSGGLFVLVTGILMLISFIVYIMGVTCAARDEQSFHTAMIAILAGIITSVVGTIFAGNVVISCIATIVSHVCEIVAFVFCITGIRHLAEAIGDNRVAEKSDKLLKLIIAVYVISIALTAATSFAAPSGILSSILSVVASICAVVAYFMYLFLLGDAKKMLAAAGQAGREETLKAADAPAAYQAQEAVQAEETQSAQEAVQAEETQSAQEAPADAAPAAPEAQEGETAAPADPQEAVEQPVTSKPFES